MKKFMLIALICAFVTGELLMAQNAQQTSTVSYVKSKGRHYDNVVLQGKVTRQIDDDEYILADNTGSIIIELEDQAEYAVYGHNLRGATVRVFGVVDKDDWDDPIKVKVLKIRVMSGGTAIPDNF